MQRLYLIFAPIIGIGLLAFPHTAFASDDEYLNSDQLIEMLDTPPRTRGLVKVKVDPSSHSGKVALNIQFAFDSSTLLPEARRQLDELARALSSSRLSEFIFEIAGHTDARGDENYNLELSEARAVSVKEYLLRKYPIRDDRLTVKGWGEQQPLNPDNPEAGENRRVEIINLGLN